MPNWCANRLVITPVAKDGNVHTFFTTMNTLDRGQTIPFNLSQTVPMPDDIDPNIGLSDEDMKRTKGHNWYDWRRNNWGTKWDVRDVEVDRRTSKRIEIHFDTAWSPPLKWLETVSKKFPKLNFKLFYCDNGMPFHGQADAVAGEILDQDHKDHDTSGKIRGAFRKKHRLHAYA